MAVYASQSASKGPFAKAMPSSIPTASAPAGTFAPGTKVQVGNHRVIIERYLSEGGFAHVYVVRLPRPVEGNEKAVLKRVAVPDKENLANMRTEVETMKRLRGHKHIVKYIDSHASQLKGGGYEVFLLMEFCQGGGLIDFMNTRLQNRLTEPEIIKIFTDVAEGVACMHYLKPPLMHRDLKVENVLISTSGASKYYKLCDFGSTAPARPAAMTAAEGRLIEDDIQRHTTLQYRSPEMIDVYRKQPIDEKSDVWALGVLLYKLCYYTTPFEDVGQMAILNAKFKFPGYPRFSDQMKLLIASMLRERPSDRPNIHQVLQKTCQLDKRELSFADIYSHRSKSESRKDQVLPNSPGSSQSRAGATLLPPKQEPTASIPDIAPMRRGRPTKPVSHHGSAKPSPSPLRMIDSSDPFAALDGSAKEGGDELSSRFPTLDQFSLMTDRGKRFAFDSQSETKQGSLETDQARKARNSLADEVFAKVPIPPKGPATTEKPSSTVQVQPELERKRSLESKELETREMAPTTAYLQRSNMTSIGTMTMPSPSLASTLPLANQGIRKSATTDVAQTSQDISNVPTQPRSIVNTSKSGSRLADLLREDASRSQPIRADDPKSPTSSRPSLEGGRPRTRELEVGVSRSRSLNLRNRPQSSHFSAESSHVRGSELKKASYDAAFVSAEPETLDSAAIASDTNITSDVDFLKAMEEEDRERKVHHKRLSSGSKHGKRTSLPHIALSGTKNLLAGRFGDAFRKFESNHDSVEDTERNDSPSHEHLNRLTPIAGSEATDLSDDRAPFEETEDLSPEMRRELEKRRLEAEEKRVANAAAEYRLRIARGSGGGSGSGGGGGAKAAAIQNKVHSLLGDNMKPAQKTASGYGRFTDIPGPTQTQNSEKLSSYKSPANNIPQESPVHSIDPKSKTLSAPPSSAQLSGQAGRPQRPIAPPKPKGLRREQNDIPVRNADNFGQTEKGPVSPGDDWESNFSKKYPSLSGLEMVETEIDVPKKVSAGVREV